MLQVIVFAIFLGLAINVAGEKGKRIQRMFVDFDVVILHLVNMVIRLAPYGVFCLVAAILAHKGIQIIGQLFSYFMTVTLVLMLQLALVYPALLKTLAGLSPSYFLKKFSSAMIFAFSTSSSTASIPVVLSTCLLYTSPSPRDS